MGRGCWACGTESVSQDLLSRAPCANMLLNPSVPVPLREGNILLGLLLPSPLNVVQEILDIGLPLLLSGGPGGPGPVGTSGGGRCLLLRCCWCRQGRPAQYRVNTGFPTRSLLPLSWLFSQREMAFAETFKNLHLLVVWVVGLLQYPSRIYGKPRETPGTLPPCCSSSPKVPSQPTSSFHLSESFYSCL